MRQVLQHLRTGATEVANVPAPAVGRGQVLIRTSRTLVSAGTERMLVEFGKSGWIAKARQQPDKVRMVLDKIRTDGLAPTIEAVFNKLDQPLPLGYSSVGVVMETGAGAHGFAIGDRVVSNGRHAEVAAVPANLCARVPDGVSDETAAFTVVGAIGLQGIRLVQPTLGEAVVVTGLGLIGLMTVQLLREHGCRVLGVDYDPARCDLARQFGAEVVNLSAGDDLLGAARAFSRGRGVDAVLLTASTSSDEPVHQAAQMCRKRGRIVLVGVTGLSLSRADFYEKELSFQVSCSYGPGRYDRSYEEQGVDYPVGFVRWTEQRNFEAVLDMMAGGRLDVAPLVTHRYPIAGAERAYEVVAGSEPSLGIVLEYPSAAEQPDADLRRRTIAVATSPASAAGTVRLGFVGAGNYSSAILIPAFAAAGAELVTVASAGGVSGLAAARKFGFASTTTDTDSLLRDPAITAVVIATRHDSHADLACRALEAGKHVFVEKPLALTLEEVTAVERVLQRVAPGGRGPLLMVGFNRRFAPQVARIRSLLQGLREPVAFIMTVNAGAVPADHWTRDLAIGGGRIVGEGCHFVDLLRFLAGAAVTGFEASGTEDRASINLRFANDSSGTVHYLATGHKSYPKERLEVFAAGRVLALDNFRRLRGYGWPGFGRMNLWRQDKGQRACAAAFVNAVSSGGPSPIPPAELFEVSRTVIEVAEALRR